MSNECDRFLGPNRDSDSTSIDESNADHYLSIDGMMCQKNCGSTVEKALCSVPGVTKVIVTFLKKEARVWGTVSSQLLIEAVENVGFDAVLRGHSVKDVEKNVEKNVVIKATQKTSSSARSNEVVTGRIPTGIATGNIGPNNGKNLSKDSASCNAEKDEISVVMMNISGMSCTSCVRSLETGLMKSKGIQTVRVALLAEKAEIIFNSTIITTSQIVEAISHLGYTGRILSTRKIGEREGKCLIIFESHFGFFSVTL